MNKLLIFLLLGFRLFAQITPETASQQLRNTIIFPVEVFGKNGASESINLNLNTSPSTATGLKLTVHGLTYTNKMSVKLNNSPWKDLNNSNVVFLNPIQSASQGMATTYFTGPFSTFYLYVPFSNAYFFTTNTVTFRFNDFNGLTIGFRVLDIGIMNSNYVELALNTKKVQDDPSKWKPYSTSAARINNGSNLWYNGTITHNGVAIRARCNDCHVDGGYDLKYFNYSNKSIVLRSTALHSLSLQDSQDIASFIRSVNIPYEPDARPWNPPYQPGPGLDSKPVRSWAAGAGLNWVLWNDFDILTNIFPMLTTTNLVNYGTNGLAPYNPLLTLNQREIPTVYQYPDWNRWLPHIHPLDGFPNKFPTRESFFNIFNNALFNPLKAMSNKTNQALPIINSAFYQIGEWHGPIEQSVFPSNFANIESFRNANPDVYGKTKEYQEFRLRTMSFFKIFDVKYFEAMKEYELEELGTGPWSAKRRWHNFANRVFFSAPHTQKISLFASDIPNMTPYPQWGPESGNWYLLAMTLNDANRNAIDQLPLDTGYMNDFPQQLLTPYKYGSYGWNKSFTNRPLGLATFIFIKSMENTEKGATNVPNGYWGVNGNMGYRPVNSFGAISILLSYATWDQYSGGSKFESLINILIPKFCDMLIRFTPQQYSVTDHPDNYYNILNFMESQLKFIMGSAPGWYGHTYNFTNTINKVKTTRNTMWPDRP